MTEQEQIEHAVETAKQVFDERKQDISGVHPYHIITTLTDYGYNFDGWSEQMGWILHNALTPKSNE